MREITKIEKVYKFEELSETAKETAKNSLREIMRETQDFTFDTEQYIESIFPDSKLEVQYSLSCCQGDGLNIYGIFSLNDCIKWVLEKAPDHFTEKEKKFLLFLESRNLNIKTLQNYRYCYYLDKENDFISDIVYDLEYDYFRKIRYETIEKFSKCFNNLFSILCKELEKDGYDYFYEYTNENAKEDSDCNDFEFYENGKIYF